MNSPIWVIGTHRSGTTMITRVLEEMGVFFGSKKDNNNESLFFMQRNEEILRACGGAWDNPDPFDWLKSNQDIESMYIDKIKKDISNITAIKYWGIRKYLLRNNIEKWGWKDPRMSIMAPLWIKIFRRPKIIRIVRNGVDVASSLNVREKKYLSGNIKESRRSQLFPPFYKRYVSSVRCLTIQGAFSLWESYIKREDKIITNSELDVFSIRYEDYINNPGKYLKQIAEFIEVDLDAHTFNSIVGKIKKNKMYSFVTDDDLWDFYNNIKDTKYMKKFGYSDIVRPGK